MVFHGRSLAAFALVVIVTFISGCGRKADLVPPQKLVPVAVGDLQYTLEDNRASLAWSYPADMENGEELQAVEVFELLRAGIPEEEYCEGCPVRFDKQVLLDGGPLPDAGGTGKALYEDSDLQPGYRYLYKVRSRAGWWYFSQDSNIVSFVWRVPPAAPEDLEVKSGDRQLILHWAPVKQNIKGSFLKKVPVYQVYRRSGGADYASLGEPVHGSQYIDAGLKNGIAYSYRVQALIDYDDSLQRSGLSREESGVPRDLQPPGQPENLVAIVVPEGVKLVWQAVLSDDLAGYRIYRREEQSEKPESIGEVGPDHNQYIDSGLTAGRTWYYSITAFDTMQPPNESLPSMEAVLEF
jgi:hypothetical protein